MIATDYTKCLSCRWRDVNNVQCFDGRAPFWAMASTYYKSSFCPNCGAKMEVGENAD